MPPKKTDTKAPAKDKKPAVKPEAKKAPAGDKKEAPKAAADKPAKKATK